jgi:hypothetical protein
LSRALLVMCLGRKYLTIVATDVRFVCAVWGFEEIGRYEDLFRGLRTRDTEMEVVLWTDKGKHTEVYLENSDTYVARGNDASRTSLAHESTIHRSLPTDEAHPKSKFRKSHGRWG